MKRVAQHMALFALAATAAAAVPACNQTPVVVPLRSMERPRDVDFICLHDVRGDQSVWGPAPLSACAVDQGNSFLPRQPTDMFGTYRYRLHAVVTQETRGELAIVDLGTSPTDTSGTLINVDKRTPGYSFLPVGVVPTDVAADPLGNAVYVASAGDGGKVHVIPASILRGPFDTSVADNGSLPWATLSLDPASDGVPAQLAITRDTTAQLLAANELGQTCKSPSDCASGNCVTGTLPAGSATGATAPNVCCSTASCPSGQVCADASSDLRGSCITQPTVTDPLPPRAGLETTGRLYVLLPDATGGPKLAVFDLGPANDGNRALLPKRLPDIKLGLIAPVATPLSGAQCNWQPTGQPWFAAWNSCDPLYKPPTTSTETTAVSPNVHLSSFVVVGSTIFASDDRSEVLHVFTLASDGTASETKRLAIGGKTRKLAVSPPVPDEVTVNFAAANAGDAAVNARAAEACLRNGWYGDGKDHSADSTDLKASSFHGFCSLHRYVYLVGGPEDLSSHRGDGAVAIVDLPTRRVPSSTGLTVEQYDFAGAKMVQPFACDGPGFSGDRMPLGSLGVTGAAAVPAVSVAFVNYDPPDSTTGLRGVRCRAGAQVATTSTPAITSVNGVANAAALDQAAISWQGDVTNTITLPRVLRGTFAMVVLMNGAIVVVDIDDYDTACRGIQTNTPTVTQDKLPFFFPSLPELGSGASNEVFANPVRRHHARSARAFTTDYIPVVNGITSTNASAPTTSPNPTDPLPGLAVLAPVGDFGLVGPDKLNGASLVQPAPDNPYALATESWTVTYNGPLPGFDGNGANLTDGADASTVIVNDPGGNYCNKGVEEFDAIQIISDPQPLKRVGDQLLCDRDSNNNLSQACQQDDCFLAFGDPLATPPLAAAREMTISDVHQGRLVAQVGAGQCFHRPGDKPRPPDPKNELPPCLGEPYDHAIDRALYETCFQGQFKYRVRARGSWVVVGSATGYLHRRVAVTPSDPDSRCTVDHTQPWIYQGRVTEIPTVVGASGKTIAPSQTVYNDPKTHAPNCALFVNPSWVFGIRAGLSGSQEDMQYSFTGRWQFQPLTLSAGSLPTTLKPLAWYRTAGDGTVYDFLSWNMITAIDAVDRGLSLISIDNQFANSKYFN